MLRVEFAEFPVRRLGISTLQAMAFHRVFERDGALLAGADAFQRAFGQIQVFEISDVPGWLRGRSRSWCARCAGRASPGVFRWTAEDGWPALSTSLYKYSIFGLLGTRRTLRTAHPIMSSLSDAASNSSSFGAPAWQNCFLLPPAPLRSSDSSCASAIEREQAIRARVLRLCHCVVSGLFFQATRRDAWRCAPASACGSTRACKSPCVDSSAWPSICWMKRMSAPPSSISVAIV